MNAAVFAEVIVTATEIISYSLNGCIEFVRNLVHGAIRQSVLEATEFVEAYSLCHISIV